MEMAGIVTYTGAHLIMQARELVEQVGRPLELDTDGIWCILPSSFPQDYKFQLRSGKKVTLEYPCAMLNADVAERYTNHQYQDLVKNGAAAGGSGEGAGAVSGVKKYATHSECSIFFELDGPYKAMVLPASPEEGKLLKKKYAVFNFDGSLAELKGFELKRRGELEVVKFFQSQVFEHFLSGSSLQEVYDAVGAIGNQWLDVLDTKGIDMDDDELLHLISEKKTISKTVEDYEGRKATSLTTALRLADFLGAEMVKDKGLNCNLIISRLPAGAPVTERAIPVAIFSAETAVKEFYLRKWLKDPQLDCDDFRDVVDWVYYKDRLGRSIQKIITIPAGLQRISNPCARVEHPVWLQRQLAEALSGQKQQKITSMFKRQGPDSKSAGLIVKNTASNASSSTGSGGSGSGGGTASDILYGKGTAGGAVAGLVDIEDSGGSGPRKGGVPIVHSRKRAGGGGSPGGGGADMEVEDLTPAPVTHAPPMMDVKPQTEDELQAWLDSRKETWGKLKRERRARRAAGDKDGDDGLGRKKAVGVAAMVRNAALSAEKETWQIFEIQETETPGAFVVWAMTGRRCVHFILFCFIFILLYFILFLFCFAFRFVSFRFVSFLFFALIMLSSHLCYVVHVSLFTI
jgi:DNA polymerase epsilon subunit 1